MASVRGSKGRSKAAEPSSGRATNPLAAYRFKNKEVQTDSGQPGRVTSILMGEDGHQYAVVDFGRDLGRHLAPLASFEYSDGRFYVHEADIAALPSYEEGQNGMRFLEPDAMVDIAGYPSSKDEEDASILVESSAPQVTVERPALAINWQQAAPQVTVHQPTPHVNVRQGEPEIIVRQPPPKITVEVQEPEILVRMPEPDVDISMAEPEVQVTQAKPFVEVVQPDAPQVNFTAADPVVSMKPRGQADVAVQSGQPNVRYERTGDPQVQIRQMEGGPKIRIEKIAREGGQGMAAGAMPSGQQAREQARGYEQQQARGYEGGKAEKRRRGGAAEMGGGPTIGVSELQGLKVYSYDGDEVGTVQRVLIGRDDQPFIVMKHGGILGFLSHKLLLPMSSLSFDGERLLVRDLKVTDIERLEAWDENMELYSEASPNASIEMRP